MTPFYDKNARKMFTHILRASPPTDDPRLSERVSQTVDDFLCKDPHLRRGAPPPRLAVSRKARIPSCSSRTLLF